MPGFIINKQPDLSAYQALVEKGVASGYAPLDAGSRVPATNAPAKAVYTTGGGQALIPGDIGAEATANKGAASGYAPLNAGSQVPATNAPAKAVYATGGGQALIPGDIGAEATANKGAASGYAPLDAGSQVPATNAPAKAVYATGGGQALIPGDIGAEATANKGAASGYAPLNAGSQVPATNAPAKAVYATGGAQALIPSDIGALSTPTNFITGDLNTLSYSGSAVDTLSFLDQFATQNARWTVEPGTGTIEFNYGAGSRLRLAVAGAGVGPKISFLSRACEPAFIMTGYLTELINQLLYTSSIGIRDPIANQWCGVGISRDLWYGNANLRIRVDYASAYAADIDLGGVATGAWALWALCQGRIYCGYSTAGVGAEPNVNSYTIFYDAAITNALKWCRQIELLHQAFAWGATGADTTLQTMRVRRL